MAVIRLLFLWHMHQPFYKDLVTGTYRLPWVRLHALKDYYGMVKLLDEFPAVHQTFNLVPSLVTQIEDYVSGSAKDPFLDIAARPAADLDTEERIFALRYLFQANHERLIGRYPRYRDLHVKFRAYGEDPVRAERYFHPQEFADLQVLSQIAWFDEFLLEEPDVAELVRKGQLYSRQDQEAMLAIQQRFLATVLPAYRSAAERGLIEISTSPFYHPILPLVCDTNAGAESTPGLPLPRHRYRHPEDAREQLERGLALHERAFGMRPRGSWPSEGSVSDEALAIAARSGIEWMATDEGVLGRTLGAYFERDDKGRLRKGLAGKLFNIYRWEQADTAMHLVFRDHNLSDLIGFSYSGMDTLDAVSHFLEQIKQNAMPALATGRDAVVPIILDGENAWEHYHHSGREFLRRLYDAIERDPVLECATVSEAISRQQEFGRLSRITPGSWINANFQVWIGAPEDNLAWDHLYAAREHFERNAANVDQGARDLAFEELLIAEGSDWNWWYGPEHHSANDSDFDELYRKHLSNVYQALGAKAPEALALPIIAPQAGKSRITPQTAFIRPRISARSLRYFDWIGAATCFADRHSAAMHGKQFLLDALYAGIDDSNLYARLDFVGGHVPANSRVVFTVEKVEEGKTESLPFRVEARIEADRLAGFRIGQAVDPDPSTAANGPEPAAPGLLVTLTGILQAQIPLSLLGAKTGDSLRLRCTVWRDRVPLDSLPAEAPIEIPVATEEALQELTDHVW